MINLLSVTKQWGTAAFDINLKNEIEKLSVNELPLQQGLSSSNIALDKNLKAIILTKEDMDEKYNVKVGVFYTGIISGCNCADDPSPVDEQNEYCEVILSINKETGDTLIKLLKD